MNDYSFIYMLRASTLEFVYVSESVTEVLGFNEQDLLGRSIELFLNPEESNLAMRTLRDTARNNKAACLVYLQLLHKTSGFEVCVMAQSAANNVIVGSIFLAATGAATATVRNDSAEEVTIITESIEPLVSAPTWSIKWPDNPQHPRSALLLDRFTANCTITHCTNKAILNPDTCINHPGGLFRYVVQRDEQAVRSFISDLKRFGIGAGAPANNGFLYSEFTMCTSGREARSSSQNNSPSSAGCDEVPVSVIGSATSDALILIVRRNDQNL